MIKQTVLSFKLETTRDLITSHAGLALMGEFAVGLGLNKALDRMPCGQFGANAVFFRIGVLAYNVGRLFVLSTLDMSWHRHQVQTLRWKPYGTAGKIVFHGRYVYLKVSRSLQKLFAQVRLRSWDFART